VTGPSIAPLSGFAARGPAASARVRMLRFSASVRD
jgi:hypothetical protein